MRRRTVRLSTELDAALRRAAAAESRAEADQVRHYLMIGLLASGYLRPVRSSPPPQEPPR